MTAAEYYDQMLQSTTHLFLQMSNIVMEVWHRLLL